MVRLGRLTLYGAVSTSVFAWTVLNAFRQRSNFYAAAVYLSKSNACMMILWNQAVYQTVLLGKLMQAVFFGELRLIEVERLQERGWFAITETLLALTIFREEFESSFVMLFISLLFFKVFHWLASDRVEMMEQTAQVTRTQHARMIGLLSVLWISDISLLIFAVDTILLEGPTVMIMFASEYMILLANVWSATAKYIINTIDMRSEENWEQKSIYVFYVELAADFFKLLTYLIFFGLILTFYGLPLNILRDVYLTFRSFILKIRDLRRYRQATKDMETLYPNATREEMEAMADKTCIICREDMEYRAPAGEAAAAGGAGAAPAPEGGEGGEGAEAAPAAPAGPRGPNDTPKKLPCGHVFHFHCLKSWLERQQSCPTCRRPVLPSEQPAAPPAAPGQRPPLPGNAAPPVDGAPPAANAAAADRNGADAVRQSQINLARALGREGFALLFPGVPFPPEAEAEAAAGGAGGGAAARLPQPTANGGPTLAVPPTPERVLQDPGAGAAVAAAGGAGGAEAGPSTSPPQPTPTAATPASIIPLPAAQAGNGALNPLAAFNLPQLPVPATGEAGLYHSPPSFSYPSTSTAPPPFPSATSPSPYANLAYGAYPHFSQFGPTGGMAPPPFPLPAGPTQLGQRHAQLAQRGQHGSGSGWRAGNVEEKMGRLRESWEREERRKEKGKGTEGEVAEDEEQEEEKHEKEEVSEEKEKKKDDKEERQGSEEKEEDSPVNRRRAAFRTAEARLGGSKISAKDKGKGKAVEGDVADSSSSPSIHERPQVSPRASSETVTSPLQTSASTATRPAPPPLGSNQHLPRLIPLFDPTSPSVPFPLSRTTFPPLLPTSSTSSSSLPPSTAAPITDEAQQLDALVQQALERKLKLLVEFQGRVEGLVEELKGVVEGGSVATAVSPEPAVEDGAGEETAAVKEGAETVLGEAGVEDGEGEK